MKIKLILFFCFLSLGVFGKSGLLDYVISVDIKNTPIKVILKTIEEVGNIKFSYNPDLIPENKKVTLQIKQKTIRYGLNLIFEGKIRFKEIGNHIVLLEHENKEEVKARKKTKTHFLFKGRIRDKLTGLPIKLASIYDVDSRLAALSDEQGNYNLSIPISERVRSLYFSKKGYRKVVLVLKTEDHNELVKDINLIPKSSDIEKIITVETTQIPVILEDKALSGILISREVYSHTENLPEINESRWAQISFVPSLGMGSNLSNNGLITNRFSLNILSGYSNGVKGLELGGIANIVKGQVTGFQAGGITNIVGKQMNGIQASGIVNVVKLNTNGMQFSGIANVCRSHFNGIQASGIVNSVSGYVYGVEIAGIGNDVNGGFKGVQIGGIINSVKKDFFGLQASALANATQGSFYGLQIGGISNIIVKNSFGFQIAGIQNVARNSLTGGQISGLFNFAKSGTNFFQAAGLINYSNFNNGIQTVGAINYTNKNNGLQVGLINISKENNGVSLGLINFVFKGYHKFEVSTNETSHLNLSLKSGATHFYNVYQTGIRFEDDNSIYSAGFGFGSQIPLSEKSALSIDLIGGLVFNAEEFELTKQNKSYSQLHKFILNFDYKPVKWISFFAGPTFNVNINMHKDNYVDLAYNSVYKTDIPGGHLNMWVGGQFGIRL